MNSLYSTAICTGSNVFWFEDDDNAERLISEYEEWRRIQGFSRLEKAFAVDGEIVLRLLEMGMKPFRIYMTEKGLIKSAIPMQLAEITLGLVLKRHENGRAKFVEIWAEDVTQAKLFALSKDTWGVNDDAPPEQEIPFMDEPVQSVKVPEINIPGFGTAISLEDLE